MSTIAEASNTRILSPRTGSGSFMYSLIAHVGLAALIVGLFKFGFSSPVPAPEYVDLDYQMLDDVPPANPVEQKIKRSVEPTVKNTEKVDPKDTVKELQDDNGDVTGTQKAKVENNIGADSNGTANSTPYYKVKPKYPQAALVSGVEGWIELKIDINEQGEVENVRVIGGEQRNTFQSEARRAVEKWKYKPFLNASGVPVKKIDHVVRVDFKLQDSESTGS